MSRSLLVPALEHSGNERYRVVERPGSHRRRNRDRVACRFGLLRRLADKTGVTTGFSRALAAGRVLGHDRGRVLADLACAIAGGARAISDFRVLADQAEAFGQVASVPTACRTLEEIAGGGEKTARKLTAAVSAARRYAWAPPTECRSAIASLSWPP